MKLISIFNLQNIHLFFACALLACMPFAVVLMSYIIILWLLSGLILYLYNRKTYTLFVRYPGIIAMLAYYLLVGIACFWSSDTKAALFDVQVKLSLLLVPIPIVMLASLYRKYRSLLLKVFVLANVAAGLVCMAVALFHSLQFVEGALQFNTVVPGVYEDVNTAPSSWFAYTHFSIFKHPAYFSMYLVMCVFIVIHLLNRGVQLVKHKWMSLLLYIICLLQMLVTIYFLQSKAGYVGLFFLLMMAAVGYLITKRKVIIGILLLVAVLVMGTIFIKTNSRFYYVRTAMEQSGDFMKTMKERNYQLMIDRYGIDRIPLWLVSMEAAGDHLWVGCGSGDVHMELNKKFEQYQIKTFIESKYNAHNQYIETLLAQGIVGLLLLLAWLSMPLFNRRLYVADHALTLIFSGLILVNFFFESMLNAFSGVIFTAFFYVFFVVVDHTANNAITKSSVKPPAA